MSRATNAQPQPKLFDPGYKADRELAALAKEINKSDTEVVRLTGQCLETARHTGELLLEAKRACGHGKWLIWLKVNVKCSQQSANVYMRLAGHWDQITNAGNFIAQMSIRQALSLLDRGGLKKSGLVPAADSAAEPEAGDPKGGEDGAGFGVRDGCHDFYTVKLHFALSQEQRWQEMVATARADFNVDTDDEAVFRALETYTKGRGAAIGLSDAMTFHKLGNSE
jgi:hypothetical protein